MAEIQKKSKLQRVKDLITRKPVDRVTDAYGIMKEVGGMRPLFNVRDLEQRRTEISEILTGVAGKTLESHIQKEVVDKTFRLFFLSGSPWYRGLDNRELSSKVADFLDIYIDIGPMPAFLPDLFMCAMQLLHLSYQALDVTNTPAYVISSTPFVMNTGGGASPRYATPNEPVGAKRENER